MKCVRFHGGYGGRIIMTVMAMAITGMVIDSDEMGWWDVTVAFVLSMVVDLDFPLVQYTLNGWTLQDPTYRSMKEWMLLPVLYTVYYVAFILVVCYFSPSIHLQTMNWRKTTKSFEIVYSCFPDLAITKNTYSGPRLQSRGCPSNVSWLVWIQSRDIRYYLSQFGY